MTKLEHGDKREKRDGAQLTELGEVGKMSGRI